MGWADEQNKRLKTLDEFGVEWGDGFGIVRKDELKVEAIKWIKYHDSINKELDTKGLARYPNELNKWIKHFFNITDEELSK